LSRVFRIWKLQNNGKKGIRRWKQVFMCDLKWQRDYYKSVASLWVQRWTVNCIDQW
jgi:hypothetical protein